jgi:hypothetical protein
MRTLAAVVTLFLAPAALSACLDEADKAIAAAVEGLEKALAAAKTPAEKAKLAAAISALKAASAPAEQNNLISDFVDKTEAYKGKTLTFRLAYVDRTGPNPLRTRLGDQSVPFRAVDPNNGAKLLLGLDFPKDLDGVPNAKDGEEVVVTFRCTVGDTSKGNVVVAARRP